MNPVDNAFVYEATAARFEGELLPDELESLTDQLSQTQALINETRACVIYGYGSQATALYRELAEVEGAEVVWHANCGPWWMTPLLWVAASRCGLVKIDAPNVVPEVFGALAHQAMVGLYSFERDLMDSVTEHVNRHKWRSEVAAVVGADPSYFCLGADGDNYDVPSGLFGWCTFGSRCPPELQAIVENKSRRVV